MKKCIKYLLDIDLNSFLNNNVFNLILAMKFAITRPCRRRGMITSTGQKLVEVFLFLERDGSQKMKEGFQRLKKEIDQLSRLLELSKVIQYLKDREKEGGGFSFAPELYPDLEDTYFAVRILQFLDVDVDRNNTAKYLKNINWKEVGFPRAVYMLLYVHLSLGIELPRQLIDLSVKDWSGFTILDAQYFSDEIRRLLHQPPSPLPFVSPFRFQGHENLQTLRKKVSILLDRDIDFDREQIVRWVQLSQNGDGGFGFYPETTSYMENTYCALEILSMLGSSPVQIELCRKYILSCQTKNGGFCRAPASFPFIESTYHAVTGLLLLNGMEEEKVSSAITMMT